MCRLLLPFLAVCAGFFSLLSTPAMAYDSAEFRMNRITNSDYDNECLAISYEITVFKPGTKTRDNNFKGNFTFQVTPSGAASKPGSFALKSGRNYLQIPTPHIGYAEYRFADWSYGTFQLTWFPERKGYHRMEVRDHNRKLHYADEMDTTRCDSYELADVDVQQSREAVWNCVEPIDFIPVNAEGKPLLTYRRKIEADVKYDKYPTYNGRDGEFTWSVLYGDGKLGKSDRTGRNYSNNASYEFDLKDKGRVTLGMVRHKEKAQDWRHNATINLKAWDKENRIPDRSMYYSFGDSGYELFYPGTYQRPPKMMVAGKKYKFEISSKKAGANGTCLDDKHYKSFTNLLSWSFPTVNLWTPAPEPVTINNRTENRVTRFNVNIDLRRDNTVTFRYPDVGKITWLFGGVYYYFEFIPAGLIVTADTDSNGAVATAQESFKIDVQAAVEDGNGGIRREVSKTFGSEGRVFTPEISFGKHQAPSPYKAVLGNLSTGTFSSNPDNETGYSTNVEYDEVGTLDIEVLFTDWYQGERGRASGKLSATFKADHLKVKDARSRRSWRAEFGNANGDFTYFGQEVTARDPIALTVEAFGKRGKRLENYYGDAASLQVRNHTGSGTGNDDLRYELSGPAYTGPITMDSHDLSKVWQVTSSGAPAATFSFSPGGIGQVTIDGPSIVALRDPPGSSKRQELPIDPINLNGSKSTKVGVILEGLQGLVDGYGATVLGSRSEWCNNKPCMVNLAAPSLKYGRVAVSSSKGSERRQQSTLVRLQTWDGEQYVQQQDDVNTEVVVEFTDPTTRDDFGLDDWLDPRNQSLGTWRENIVLVDQPAGTGPKKFSSDGELEIVLPAAPLDAKGEHKLGTVRVEVTPPPHLQYDYDGDNALDKSTGVSVFGVYSGGEEDVGENVLVVPF